MTLGSLCAANGRPGRTGIIVFEKEPLSIRANPHDVQRLSPPLRKSRPGLPQALDFGQIFSPASALITGHSDRQCSMLSTDGHFHWAITNHGPERGVRTNAATMLWMTARLGCSMEPSCAPRISVK